MGLFFMAWFAYVPSFPSSLPSSEKTGAIEETYDEQNQFFTALNRIVRSQHGNLVLTSELDKGTPTDKVTYRHVYARVNEEKLFETFQKIAKENQFLLKIRKKKQGPYSYEFEFAKGQKAWLTILAQVESVEEGNGVVVLEKPITTVTPVETAQQKAKALESATGRLVIIVDDMGQNIKIFNKFSQLDEAITFSILPRLPHTKKVAKKAQELNYDVMLHLPMQPNDFPTINPGEGALLVHDEAEVTMEKLLANMSEVPNAIGVNNHMGSAFTQYAAGMDQVMRVLKKGDLFFLDSKTASGRVSKNAAMVSGVPFLSRDIFLDDNPDPIKVREQLAKASEMAISRGLAIAICHPRASTFEILKEDLPQLKAKGIRIVRISLVVAELSSSPR